MYSPFRAEAAAWRRGDDLVVGGLDVLRRQLAAVVELHAAPQREGVRAPVLGDRPGFGQVADHLGAALVGRVRSQQGVVVRRRRVDEGERLLSMRVVGGWLSRYDEDELAAVAGFVLSGGGRDADEEQQTAEDSPDDPSLGHWGLPPSSAATSTHRPM